MLYKAIELNPKYAKAYYSKGNALSRLGNHQEAITYYNKAIELNPKYAKAYNSKGNALYRLGNHQEAITCYNESIELNPDYTIAQNNKKLVLQVLEETKRNKEFPPKIEQTYLSLYDSVFFNEATKDISDIQHYEKIYTISLKILKELQVKDDIRETNVAHYTTKKTSQILFFDKDKDEKPIPFRLNSVTNSNDIQEGKTLFNYLFENKKICPQSEQFVAFVGCFMFNHDNLNQFRLYGKDDESQEGTGISIIMKPDFFCSEDKSPIQQEYEQTSPGDNKAPLFRCIYIDPETNQVVSVGHRDYHTFYKIKDIIYSNENKKKSIIKQSAEIKKYKKNIDAKIEKVVGYLEELKETINEKGLDFGVVCNLLLNLRYLVKHVAFKEEQECRIIKIKKPFESDDNSPIDDNHQRFYVNYLPLNNCVSKLYFGPKALGMELFQSLLTYQKDFENVICNRSTSPLA